MKKKKIKNQKNKTKVDINNLLQLANLFLDDQEKIKIEKQLNETFGYIDVLKELKLDNLDISRKTVPLSEARADFVKTGFSQKSALKNASQKEKKFFIAPKLKWRE